MAVLKIRDENGNFIGVQSIKGDKGEDGAIQYTAGENIEITADNVINCTGGGVSDYVELTNKPKINNVELTGSKTLDELNIQPKGNYLITESDPTVPSHVKNITQANITNWNNKLDSVPNTYKTKQENDALYQPIGTYVTETYVNEKTQNNIITAGLLTTSTWGATTSKNLSMSELERVGDKLTVEGTAITVGSGVSKVKVTGNLRVKNNVETSEMVVNVYIYKNDAVVVAGRNILGASEASIIAIPPKLLSVAEGDTLQLGFYKNNTNSLTTEQNDSSYLTVEVVE